MGIDIKDRGRTKKSGRRVLKSNNAYRRLGTKLYDYLARRTDSSFNKIVAHRMKYSRRVAARVSLSKISKLMMTHKDDEIAVCVCPVTDDNRLASVAGGAKPDDGTRLMVLKPKIQICARSFTATARARVAGVGGKCYTFDQLAELRPTGKGCVLVRGAQKCRKVDRHFGPAPGTPGSTTVPYALGKGRKFEKARGRRKSRAFKV